MLSTFYKVVDPGSVYTTYNKFFERYYPDLLSKYVYGETVDISSHRYYLIGEHNHTSFTNLKVCLIQDIQTQQVYLIGPEGIEKTND